MGYEPLGRVLRISGSALPDGTFLHAFVGRERLGRLFKFKILFSCPVTTPLEAKFLGSPVWVSLKGRNGDRTFNGLVAQCSTVEMGKLAPRHLPGRILYRAIVRPRLWRLTRSSHCRFFHDKTVLEITRMVLDDQGVPFRDACIASYPRWEHCVQYRETDLDFLSRLWQREGIYYYFEHKGGTDTLVLMDDSQQHEAIPRYGTIPFHPGRRSDGTDVREESIYVWKADRRVVPGRGETNSFDFMNVARSTSQGLRGNANSDEDKNRAYVVQEPALWYVDDGNANRYARNRLDAHTVGAARATGRASAAGMCPGAWFNLSGHPSGEQNRAYLVTDVKYWMSDGYFPARGGGEDDAGFKLGAAADGRKLMNFDCRFRAIPRTSPYRQRCRAAVPSIGPQTAMVLAPEGDELATDSYGRVKVQFHWEQFNPPKANQEMQRCWVRVAQAWAGDRWGAVFLPRKGQEVLVEFLNGDPDKPVVTGGLYNGKNKPPYALPDAAAVSAIYTHGTGNENAGKRNELRFNDEKLQILLYTDGNQDNYIERDSLAYIGHDSHTIIENAQLVEAKSQHITVGEKQMTRARDVSLNASLGIVHEAGEKYVVKSELVHVKADATLVLEATAMVSLKVGDSFVSVTPAGVQISGPMVLLNSGGAAGSGPGGSTTMPDHPKKADDGKSVKRN
ncbi:Gp5/Type VI secretion system Vgr protein OB-fold domain-containing protein [Bordetella sputigena]|uniref:type VI secretion system Vgr family protein n=1 Tax=Bordetella sputigena TaxID=1416810 RepID=UPI0039EFBFC3